MKRIPCFLLTLCILIAYAFSAPAQILDSSPTKTIIRVGFPIQAGLTEKDANGDFSGYTYEYLERLCQFTGWTMEYITPEGDLNQQILTVLDMLEKGELDLVGCSVRNEALEELYQYSSSNYGIAYSTLSTLETNAALNEVTFPTYAKEGLRVAAYAPGKQRTQLLDAFCTSNGYPYTIDFYEGSASLTDVLIEGKADVCLGVDLSRDQRTKIIATFAGAPYYFIGKKGNTALMQELDAAMLQLEQSSPYIQKELHDKYFSNSGTEFVLKQSEIDYIQSSAPLKVLIQNELPPFQHLHADGQYAGIAISTLDELSNKTGLVFEYVGYDGTTPLMQFLEENNISMISSMVYDYKGVRGKPIVLGQPFCTTEVASFSNIRTEQTHDATPTLALVEGTIPSENYADYNICYYPNLQSCIEAVNDGKADYGYGNSYSVSYFLTRNDYPNVLSIQLPGESQSYCFGFVRPLDIELLTIFNRAVTSLDSTASHSYLMEELVVSHGSFSFARYVRMHPWRIFTAALSIILIFVFIWLRILHNLQRSRLLKAQNDAKSAFLSRMSHDMRTPMNAIIGLSGLAQEMDSLPQIHEYLDKIYTSGQYLLGLINDTLDMNCIESGKIELNPIPYPADVFLKDIESLVAPKAKAKGINFSVTFSSMKPYVLLLDRLRLLQIFTNLLTNAIKFTPEGGTVELIVATKEEKKGKETFSVTVKDNGIGMSESFQKQMYDAFEQESNAKTSDETGTGLGLCIVKKLVDLMEGSISCCSEKGKGTTFVVTLTAPILSLPDKDILLTPPSDDHTLDYTLLQGKQVLLAEDHPLNIQVATKLLERQGILVETVENGKEAVAAVANAPEGYFDAILMDIRMPKMDGLEAAKQIRKLPREDVKKIPIIAMTANAYQEDIENSFSAGMNAHIVKPIQPKLLYDTLIQCFELKRDI